MEPNRLSLALAIALSLLSFPAKGQQDTVERKLSFANKPPSAVEITRLQNYKSPRWFEEFEFEIKNKSDKDIV
jgi:hypothetical protein